MGDKELSHKELLTFSNLTNLKWEFVDLEAIAEGDYDAGQGIMEDISTQLNDLLSPKVFARRDEEGEVERYIYGTDDNGNYLGKEEELIEMRQEAGMAVEYLEKRQDEGNEEGKFLENWEVIYAADNYKTVSDYLNQKWLKLINVCEKFKALIKLQCTCGFIKVLSFLAESYFFISKQEVNLILWEHMV